MSRLPMGPTSRTAGRLYQLCLTRDFEDLVGLASLPKLGLNLEYSRDWAKRLDDSIGGDEVTERIREALAQAKNKRGR